MKTNRWSILAATLATGLSGIVPSARGQQVISVQFPQYYQTSIVEPLNNQAWNGLYGDLNANISLDHLAGVVPATNWAVISTSSTNVPVVTEANQVDGNGHPLGRTLLTDMNGNATTVRFTFQYCYSDHTQITVNNDAGTPPAGVWPRVEWWIPTGKNGDAYLATGVNFTQDAANNPVVLTLEGLDPSATYDLIAYVATPWWASGSVGSATVGSTTIPCISPSEASGTWVEATGGTADAPSVGNYVRFRGLKGAATQTLTLGGNDLGLGGFQLVTVPTPPPAGTVMIVK